MKNTQVYDWPTRIFHWLFAASFVGAFFIAKTIDDDSAYYPYHMLLGLIMILAISLRIAWGLVGSRYARFSSFRLKPAALAEYFKNLLNRKGSRFLGHNPASSWAALVMMALGLGLGVTGYLMATGNNKEFYEEIHELFANLFLVTALAHVAGVVLHTLMHRDRIGLSMIHGGKRSVQGEEGIARTHLGIGLLLLALVGGFVFHLNKNYDPNLQTLNLLGATLQLGESEEHEGDTEGQSGEEYNRKDGKDSDDDDD